MGLSGKSYVVLSDSVTGKRVRASESWLEILRRWIVECPQCSEVWLVVGAREGESYACRDCGHNFAIKLQVSDRGRDASDRRGLT
jgi:predicted RNA-binding Zn-ribbon protein involved in translation (DUF1610 family)